MSTPASIGPPRARPPQTPRTAWHWLELPRWRRLLHRGVFAGVDALGRWRHPPSPFERRVAVLEQLRWLHASRRTIVQGARGHALESRFARGVTEAALVSPPDFRPRGAAVTVSLVGDLLPNPLLSGSAQTFYARIHPAIFGADLRVANFEAVLAGEGEVSPPPVLGEPLRMIVTREQIDVLTGYAGRGFDVLQLANNHALDKGRSGLDQTHAHLRARGFTLLGTNAHPDEQRRGLRVEAGGMRVGLLGATYGVNGRRLPPGGHHLLDLTPSLDHVDGCSLLTQLADVRRRGAEFVVASLHWGQEFELYPEPARIEVAHRLADAGVDAIVSHHSHVIAPFELYRPQRGRGRVVPIFYGLGNLCSLFSAPDNALSLVVELELTPGERDGEPATILSGLRVRPVMQIELCVGGRPALQLVSLEELWAGRGSLHPRVVIDVERGGWLADLALGPGWREGGCLVLRASPGA